MFWQNEEGINLIINTLFKSNLGIEINDINEIGHRVVQGGDKQKPARDFDLKLKCFKHAKNVGQTVIIVDNFEWKRYTMDKEIVSIEKSDILEKSHINSIERASMVTSVLDYMRFKILTEKHTEDYMLTEIALSKEYNVSRGSIRTALQVLEKEGLITSLSNGRKQFKGITEKYVKDLYEVRRMLECKAAKILISQRSVRYSVLASSIEDFNAIENETDDVLRKERSKINTRFHRALFELSNNSSLLQCWTTMEPIIETMADLNSATNDAKEQHKNLYINKHVELFDLIIKRDKSIEQCLIQHINDAEEETLKGLKVWRV